ncbi:MAG: hypothetical protein HZA46_20280 [Planctomycetales bacterium]|nr:hypothetical protein [Planctomycetales bacterium]
MPKESFAESFRKTVFQPGTLVLMALFVTAAWFAPRMINTLPDLNQKPEYQLAATKIRITQPPHWVPSDLVEQVVKRADLPPTLTLLNDHVVDEIANAFSLHPWVAEVVSVRKSLPAAIDVQLTYRRPVAMVQVKQGMYPVDAEGVLLPPEDFSVTDAKEYPLILDVRSTPQGPAGTSWGDITVIGASRLADVLSPHWKKYELTGISVPKLTKAKSTIDDGVYILSTAAGSRITWGRAPGSQHPGELAVEQKLGRLEKYVKDFGGFEKPHGPYEIDIRHWKCISRRSLTANRPVENLTGIR